MERRKRQLPLTPAYSFTDYRSQGQTIQNIIIDIGNPLSGTLTPFNIYVTLSRARGRNQIRLLRDFDDKLLTKHPSEYLRLEDERLGDLETKTDEWWQRILSELSVDYRSTRSRYHIVYVDLFQYPTGTKNRPLSHNYRTE